MKPINDLSRDELISLIYNALFAEVNIYEANCECAVCGTTSGVKYYYICDKCDQSSDEPEELGD